MDAAIILFGLIILASILSYHYGKISREKEIVQSGDFNVVEVSVGLGSSFNDPTENFSNYKPHVSMTAEISGSENHKKVIRQLQRDVYDVLIVEKKRILNLCHERNENTDYVEYG